jgi:uncharacterized iron-regulated protein
LIVRRCLTALLLLGLAGCAKRQSAPHLGESRNLPTEPETEPASGKRPVSRLPPDVVERAAMPFFGIRADGKRLPPEPFLRELAGADLICIGERHDNPHDHWAELRIVSGLLAHAPMRGREVAVGLEMIQLPFQRKLDEYLEWDIDEAELVDGVEWHERWGYDFAYYRPVLEHARRARLRVLALNAPRELTQKVAREGIDALDDAEEKKLPELDLDDEEHRAWFAKATAGHPTPGADKDRLYAAQVLWDETMAETATKYLRGKLPMRQLVVLAGSGHCRNSAIPARVRRRISATIASVHPVIQTAEADPAPALEGFDYAFVMTPGG